MYVNMAEYFDAERLYLLNLENEERLGNVNFRDRNNHFDDLSDTKFLERYRLSKAVVLKLLEDIEARLEYHTNRNHPLTPIQQLLLTLRFYATGSYQIVVGDTNGVSKATVCRCVRKVSDIISALRPIYITFPVQVEIQATIQKFYNIANFPGIMEL